MSVFNKAKIWPASRVPYEIVKADQVTATLITSWIKDLNQAVGFELLVSKGSTDANFLSISKGHGVSESIGFLGGPQYVSASSKFSMQHEILHALGFYHEQQHKSFPWNDNDPIRNETDDFYTYEGKLTPGSWNSLLYKQINHQFGIGATLSALRSPAAAPKAASNKPAATSLAGLDLSMDKPLKKKTGPSIDLATASKPQPLTAAEREERRKLREGLQIDKMASVSPADKQLNARRTRIMDGSAAHSGDCDFESIMMYSEMRKAAEAIVKKGNEEVVVEGQRSKLVNKPAFYFDRIPGSRKASEFLSNDDILTIRRYYRKP